MIVKNVLHRQVLLFQIVQNEWDKRWAEYNQCNLNRLHLLNLFIKFIQQKCKFSIKEQVYKF